MRPSCGGLLGGLLLASTACCASAERTHDTLRPPQLRKLGLRRAAPQKTEAVEWLEEEPLGDPEDFVSFLARVETTKSLASLDSLNMMDLLEMAHEKLAKGKVGARAGKGEPVKKNKGNAVQIFEIFDTDKSGTIGYKEFEKLITVLGYKVTKNGMLKFFKKCDTDGSGDIDIGELEEANGKSPFDLQKCINTVEMAKKKFLDMSHPEEDLPRLMEDWCVGLHKQKTEGEEETIAAKAMATAWKGACSRARADAETKAQADREYGVKNGNPFAAAVFCHALAKGLDKQMQGRLWYHMATEPTNYMPYAPPLATPGMKLKYLKNPRPCCDAHGQKGCHDTNIEACVCEVDPHCCEEEWDLECAEQVERLRVVKGDTVLRCGRCPGEDCLKKLAACIDGCDCNGGDETSTWEQTGRTKGESADKFLGVI